MITLETRADSTVVAPDWLLELGIASEYDPMLRRLLVERRQGLAQAQTAHASRTADPPDANGGKRPFVRGAGRRLNYAKTSWCAIQKLGYVEAPFDISPKVDLRNPEQISLSLGAVVRGGSILNGRSRMDSYGIAAGSDLYVKESAYIDAYDGRITLGRGIAIAQGCVIHGNGGVTIGDYLMMSRGSMILAGNHRHEGTTDTPFILQGSRGRGVTIGRNVWIGAGAIVLDGVSVGDDAVIGAGTIISSDVPADTIVRGPREFTVTPLTKGSNAMYPRAFRAPEAES